MKNFIFCAVFQIIAKLRGLLRIQPKIYYGTFLRKLITAKKLTIFLQNTPS